MGWDDSTIQGVSLADDVILFELCFSSVGTSSVNSIISFTDNPLAIEVVTGDGMLGTFEFQQGIVAIDCSELNNFGEVEDNLNRTNIQRSEIGQELFGSIKVYPNPVQSMLYLDCLLYTSPSPRDRG